MPSGHPGRSPGAPRARPGASWDGNRVAQGRPGARRSDQLHCQAASGIENFEFCPRVSLGKQRRCDSSSHFVVFRRFRKPCEPSEVSHLSAKTGVRPIALHIDSLAQSDLEKQRKPYRKSTQNRAKVAFTVAWASFSVDFCRTKPAKSIEAIRFGTIETPRSIDLGRSSQPGRPGRSPSSAEVAPARAPSPSSIQLDPAGQAPSANFVIDI